MFINNMKDIKHDCPSYILEDITSTLMNVKSEPTEFKTPNVVKLINAQREVVFSEQAT